MKANDFIFQPQLSNFPGNVITVVIPGALIDQIGMAAAMKAAKRLTLQLERLDNSDLGPMIQATGVDVDTMLHRLLDRTRPIDLRPPTLGSLLDDVGAPPATNPDLKLPKETALVFYLDPDQSEVAAQTEVFRGRDLRDSGKSGVTFISFNATDPVGRYREVAPSLLAGLFIAYAAARGKYDSTTRNAAQELETNLDNVFNFPGKSARTAHFTKTDQVDRVGFEHEILTIAVESSVHQLGSKFPLARTRDSVLDIPILKLEVDTILLPDNLRTLIPSNKKLDYSIPELIVGPLTSREYLSPEIHLVKEIFIKQFRNITAQTSMADILRNYNAEVEEVLGSAGKRYQLLPFKDVNISEITVRQALRPDTVRYSSHATVLMPYTKIKEQAFIDSIQELRGGFFSDAAHYMSLEGSESVFGSKYAQARKLFEQADRLAGLWKRYGKIKLSPELETFAFQLFLTEFQRKSEGVVSKGVYKWLFRFSNEDVVYSILSDKEVKVISDWFSQNANQRVLREMFTKLKLDASVESERWDRMVNLLENTAKWRIKTGRAQLQTDRRDESPFTRAPGDDGYLIKLSHLNPDSRRPIVEKDGKYYVAVEYRDTESDMVRLGSGVKDWYEGDGIRQLRALSEGVFVPDAYAKAAERFVTGARALLEGPLGVANGEAFFGRVEVLMEKLPPSVPNLDEKGRIASENEGWWRAVYRNGRALADRARTYGRGEVARHIDQGLEMAFQVDLDIPQLDSQFLGFENGKFTTWRGAFTPSELGLPENWLPGKKIPGYAQAVSSTLVYRYIRSGDTGPLPKIFHMTWNGLPWPVSTLQNLPDADGVVLTKMAFTDPKTATAFVMEMPDGAIRLDGDKGHWVGYELEELDHVFVVMDSTEYKRQLKGADHLSGRDFLALKQALAVLERTKAGREILSQVKTLPSLDPSAFSRDQNFLGLTPEQVFRGKRLSMVIQLTATVSKSGLYGTDQGNFHLVSQNFSTLHYEPWKMTLDLAESFLGLKKSLLPDGTLNEASKTALAMEHALALELGAPLKALVDPSQIELLVPLDGSALLMDDQYRLMSTLHLRERLLLNRNVRLFVEKVSTLDPALGQWRIDYQDPLPAIRAMLSFVRGMDAVAPDKLRALNALKRQIQEIEYRRVSAAKEANTGNYYYYQVDASGELPTADEMVAMARARLDAWEEEVVSFLGDGEVTDPAREFIRKEVRGLEMGYRDAEDVDVWLRRASAPLKDLLFSSVLEAAGRSPKNSQLFNVLEAYEQEIGAAWRRGTLSFDAQNYLALQMEGQRRDTQSEYSRGGYDDVLILSPLGQKYISMSTVPPHAVLVLRDSKNGRDSEADKGYFQDTDIAPGETGDVRDEVVEALQIWSGTARSYAEVKQYDDIADSAARGWVKVKGRSQPVYLIVVKDPKGREILGVGLWRQDSETGNPVLFSRVLNPSFVERKETSRFWRGVEEQIYLQFVHTASNLAPNNDLEIHNSTRRIDHTARSLSFSPNRKDLFEYPLKGAERGRVERSLATRHSHMADHIMDTMGFLLDAHKEAFAQHDGGTWAKTQRVAQDFADVFTDPNAGPAEISRQYYRLHQQYAELAEAYASFLAQRRGTSKDLQSRADDLAEFLKKTAPHPDPVDVGIRYTDAPQNQVVVLLELDPVAENAARFLFEKNKQRAQFFRLQDGRLERVGGAEAPLDESSRISLVGHGTARRIGNFTAQEALDLLIRAEILSPGSEIRRISLVACASDDPTTSVVEGAPQAPFAEELLRRTHDAGILVHSISARVALVMVDAYGRKWTGVPDADGRVVWSQKNSAHKLVVQRNVHGEMVSSRVPVDQGVVRVVAGNASLALGKRRRGVIRFVDGRQVTETGNPVPSGELLAPHERMLVESILGPTPHGWVEFDGQGGILSAPDQIGIPGGVLSEEGDSRLPSTRMDVRGSIETMRRNALAIDSPERTEWTDSVFSIAEPEPMLVSGRNDLPQPIVLPDAELPMDVRLTALDQEMARLREVQIGAVERVITAYMDDHQVQVVLDPAFLVREGDRIGLAVVERSHLDENGRIPENAQRIALEVEVPGLGEAHLALFEKLTRAGAHSSEEPSPAWAGLVGASRDQEAVAYTPDQGSRPAVTPPADSLSLGRARESLEGRQLLKGAIAATQSLAAANQLSPEWIPILATLEENEGRYRIQFINSRETSETRWVETTDDRIGRLKDFMDARLGQEEVRRSGVDPNLDPAGESPDALNSAFMVQFIIGLAQDIQRNDISPGAAGTLATALEVHRYLFGAQVAYGAVLDTVKIVKLVRTLMRSGEGAVQAASRTAHALTYAGEVVGAGFMAANVILDSIQLANAENDVQRAVFGTQLAFDAAGLVLSGAGIGISITADVATAVGATAVVTAAGTAGAILGGVGVIVAGIGIGAAALAQNYAVIAQKADAIGTYFQAIDDGYSGYGFEYRTDEENPILVARPGAVVNEVNFRDNTVHFGNQYISQTTHGPSGSGKINYFFWSSDIPQENEDAELNIRTELGYADSVPLIAPNTNMVVLPATPEVHMSGLSWQTLPGATSRYDTGFEVLRRLENNYLFDYDFYTFPSEYILHEINDIDYRNTRVAVKLDSDNRTLVMPDMPSEHSGRIHYEFYGRGGEYVIALNEGSWLTLHEDGDTDSTWILDTTNLRYQGAHFQYGNLRVGGYLVVPPPGHRGQIMVVNHSRDLFSVDTVHRSVTLVSVDARDRGANLMTYLSGLSFPGRFLSVTNYEVNGRSIGNAWYDKEDHALRYADLDNDTMTGHIQLLDMVKGKLLFSAAKDGYLEIWEVDPSTHRLENRYALVASGAGDSSRLSRIWKEGDQIWFEQTQTGVSGTIIRRYRLTDSGLFLSSVNGDEALVTRFAVSTPLASNWTNPILPTVIHPITWHTSDESTAASYRGRNGYSWVDAWVSIIGRNNRVWIHKDTRAVVVPGMETIPEDLQLLGLDTDDGRDLALFYSASARTVYRQEGNHFHWRDTQVETLVDTGFDGSGWTFGGDAGTLVQGENAESLAHVNNGSISQTVEGLHSGTHYRLRFEAGGGSLTQGDGVLKVIWNNYEVGRLNWESGLAAQEISIVAEAGENTLVFVAENGETPPRFFIDNVSLKARPIIQYNGIRKLYSLGAHPIFETLTGELRRLESSGDTQLTGVTQSWLEAHPNRDVVVRPDPDYLAEHTSHDETRPDDLPTPVEVTEHRTWRMDLRQLAADQGVHADSGLVIQGLADAQDNTLAGWYDVNADRFVVAQTPPQGSMIFLGLTGDQDEAVLYDQEGRRVYSVSLLDEAALAAAFGTDHILESHVVLPSLSDVFGGTGLVVSNLVPHDGNQYLATTTNGLAFLVGHNTQPILAAVLDSWTGTPAQLQDLFTRYAHEDVVRVLRQADDGMEIQNWWIAETRQWAGLSGRGRDEIDWVGLSRDRATAYVFDKTRGELVELQLSAGANWTAAPTGRVVSRAGRIQRFVGDTDTLFVEAADTPSVSPSRNSGIRDLMAPVVDGVSALVLAGQSRQDRFVISQGIWDHYPTIVVDATDPGGPVDTVWFGPGIDAGEIVVSRDNDGNLILWDSRSEKRLIFQDALSNGGQTSPLLLPNIQVQFQTLAPIPLSTLAASVQSGAEPDSILGLEQTRVIRAGDGDDRVVTGEGNDIVYGEGGNDTLITGEGNDILVGGPGADILTGGVGRDTLVFMGDPASSTGVQVDLSVGTGLGADAQGDRYGGIEDVVGTAYDDRITGNTEANRLAGGRGDDILTGGGGNDHLLSQGGNDTLLGGKGSDTFTISGITAGEIRRVEITNGGSETDLILLDKGRDVLSHTQIRDGNLEVVADGVTLVLHDWERGAGTDTPAFRIATRDGFTYSIHSDGSLSVHSVDIALAGDMNWSMAEDSTRIASIHTQYGTDVFVIPQSPTNAAMIQGNTHANVLTGGEGDNTLISGGNWEGVDRLTGGNGADTYVVEATGSYLIDNAATDSAVDTVVLGVDYDSVQASREGNHLRLITALHFTLDVENYFTDAANRHLSFITGDGVTFEISSAALEVENHTVVRKTIIGLDFSDTETPVTINLSDNRAYPSAVMAVDSFLGSESAANTIVTDDRATQVVTGRANDRVTGGFQDDLIQTLAGTDTIDSGAGDDRIWAGDGNDTIRSGDGNDLLVGGFGADALDGGEGSDSLVYLGDEQGRIGVSVSLFLGSGSGADAEGDEIRNVENLYGTDFNDTLEGDDTANFLSGGGGDDLLVGRDGDDVLTPGSGNDHIDGGSGSDWLLYADAPTGVNIDLDRGSTVISYTGTSTTET
ncbi:MAG: C80 family cysteine peptidase, partial [Desulfobacterales bacterium]|nr:C80 family cysteine peptidase [Desulfobacterales bacterium]